MYYIIIGIITIIILLLSFSKSKLNENFSDIVEEEHCVNLCPVKKSLYDRITDINKRIAVLQEDANILKSYNQNKNS
jgi:hypothetical protein